MNDRQIYKFTLGFNLKMTEKYLYRGMSDLEFYDWIDKGNIPKNKYFASDPEEAIKIGREYIRNGELVIFQTKYDYLYFKNVLQTKLNDFDGWHKTSKQYGVNELETNILSPREAVNFYNSNRSN